MLWSVLSVVEWSGHSHSPLQVACRDWKERNSLQLVVWPPVPHLQMKTVDVGSVEDWGHGCCLVNNQLQSSEQELSKLLPGLNVESRANNYILNMFDVSKYFLTTHVKYSKRLPTHRSTIDLILIMMN